MAPRAHWKGFLKLSLVSCPIALYPAISAAEKISFRQVNRETGHRLRQQMVDSVTGEVVESQHKGRGYEVGENEFLILQDEEIEQAQQEARIRPFSVAPAPAGHVQPTREAPPKPSAPVRQRDPERQAAPPVVPAPAPPRPIVENTRTIELDRFVRRAQIDARYLNTPYYIVPRDAVGQEAFAVIRDAVAAKGLVGLGRIVLASRERPILVEPMGSGLRGITLRYAHEVRDETEYFADIPKMTLPNEMLRITEHILETKTEDFDPAYLEDRYRTVLVEKLREKQAHMPARSIASTPSPENVINLMDALRRSLATERPSRKIAKLTPHVAKPAPDTIKPTPRRTAAASKRSVDKRSSARARRVS
ncbi:MAG: end-binding protein Ku [Hyphomicrobiales bacterium]|jgi:non-homologous end joining protein Ku|nr:end-binding protein Ku [Hyphomicrobiales bacterium]